MPETPISPAKLAVSVTQVVLGWFSAQSGTVHSKVHKSQEKKPHPNPKTLKLKSLGICKKMEARSLLQRVCLSLIVSFTTTTLWTMLKHTRRHSFGETSSRDKIQRAYHLWKDPGSCQEGYESSKPHTMLPLSSITMPSNRQTAVALYPPKYRVLKGRKSTSACC